MHKLILYGAGKRCEKICEIIKQSDIEIMAVLDSNPDKWGQTVSGYVIESPEKILEYDSAYLYIAVADADAVKTIRNELQCKYQYDLAREISYYTLILEAFERSILVKECILSEPLNRHRKESVMFSLKKGFILGGIEAWTAGICEALIKSGKEEIYVIAGKGSYRVPDVLQNHVIFVDINSQIQFSADTVLNLVKAVMKKLPCKVITTKPDEIMLAAYLVKCYYPDLVEIISTIRGGQEQIYNAYMDFQKCPDIYIGVSQDIREDMIRRGVPSDKILVMSVPFACEETVSRSYTEDTLTPLCIGYAGRLEIEQKRMDLFLRLLAELEIRKVNYKVELAGDGSVREEMEQYAVSNHLTSKVKFLGSISRSEIPAFWKRQDICVNIADYEGRSHSVIEAMGNGAVPVVTATSGIKEDITDDVNGCIVPLGDYRTMADRIAYLAEHRERLNEMGRLAHDAVYPKSRMENHLKFWEDVLSHKSWQSSRV